MPEFALWLSSTGLSQAIRDNLWVIPTLQSIHIIAIAAVVSSALFINLRLLRIADKAQTITDTASRYLPWIWFGLIILLITGSLLVVGEPERELLSTPFWIKMGLIVMGAGATLGFQRSLRHHAGFWDEGRSRSAIRLYAFGTLAVWALVITAGRLIAYVY